MPGYYPAREAEQELRRRVRHADFIAAIGLALSHSPTLPEMLQSCAEAMVAHLDAAFARVWAFNEQEGVLELHASAGAYTRLDRTHARVPVGQKKIGRIAATKLPHLTNSVYDDYLAKPLQPEKLHEVLQKYSPSHEA